MKKIALSNLEYFNVKDDATGRVHIGNNQQWYGSWWRRMSGCGPTTVSNIIKYVIAPGAIPSMQSGEWTKSDSMALMDDVWKYVTPGAGGINSTERLRKGVVKYGETKNFNLHFDTLDVQSESSPRPKFENVISFIVHTLEKDIPVAFLNLDNGSEKQLDQWHWVTIVAIEYAETCEEAVIRILDNGRFLNINLKKWFLSTKKGGGFVSCTPKALAAEGYRA